MPPVILAVDDRAENLFALKEILSESGAKIVTALSGSEAYEVAIARNDIALILLDVLMPEMSGYDVAQLLHSTDSTREIPIIFLTANNWDAESQLRSYESGAVDFMPTPVVPFILKSKVRVFLDLARQRKLLEHSQCELERSNRSLQDFAHAAAHDLKAPVRHIRAWIDMIQYDHASEIGEELGQKISQIDNSSKRMGAVISALLDFATVDSSGHQMYDVKLSMVMEGLRNELSGTLAEAGGTLTIEPLPDVLGNSVLLHQLFQNLVGNCIKYRRAGEALQVRITCTVWGDICEIVTSDNGIGFDPSMAEELFLPFRRLVTETEAEGSGIGMATARKIVDAHNGRIWATGVVNEGSAFYVQLPLAQ